MLDGPLADPHPLSRLWRSPPMRIPIYQLDAFTDRRFAGNPAAVCPLDAWLPDATLQAIAAENNLSETAFFVPAADGYELRWFTPATEIDLCGHATLASGEVVFRFLAPDLRSVRFRTRRAGVLTVSRRGDELVMDFPARPAERIEPPAALAAALGAKPQEVLAGQRDYLAVFESADDVAALRPDMRALAALDRSTVIVTAPGGGGVDFVSRFFAPALGVDEDPVTGSAHCMLAPYWAKRLQKRSLKARQISARGGEIACEIERDRVLLAGKVALYLEGSITV
jgi:PhzF family phenazine biosynthesis protein